MMPIPKGTAQALPGDVLRVLVVDDAPEIRLLVRAGLERRGFAVVQAGDGESALAVAAAEPVDLVVCDVNLPGMSGLAVLRRLREEGGVPVILLTGRDDEADRVLGLELGADDYVVKPFSPTELAARAVSVLRRTAAGGPPGASRVPDGDAGLIVDRARRRVVLAGAEVELTAREFDLLAFLAAAPGRVFTRAQLLEEVWVSSAEWQDPATVTEHVRRLRRKIEPDPERPRWLQTVRSVGYRLEPAGSLVLA